MEASLPQEADAAMLPVQSELDGSEATTASNGISAEEIALYDRQIRLWGMKAQEKIRKANILLITIRALGNEIAKNLVLAGISSLTVVDHATVTEADIGSQFLLSVEDGHLGMNRAVAASAALQRLNPRVRVVVDQDDIRKKSPSFYAPFDIVIATDLDSSLLDVINTATRLHSRPFYAASSVGMYGFIFADLIEHDYIIERAAPNMPTTPGPESRTRSILSVTPKPDNHSLELVTKRELYSTWLLASDAAALPQDVIRSARRRRAVTPLLPCLRALWEFTKLYTAPPNPNDRAQLETFTRLAQEKHKALGLPVETLRSEVLRSFLQNIGSDVVPVAAFVGGMLAQDVINVLGQTQQPLQNLAIFDGHAMEAPIFALHPDGALGRELLATQQMGAGVVDREMDGLVPVPADVIALD